MSSEHNENQDAVAQNGVDDGGGEAQQSEARTAARTEVKTDDAQAEIARLREDKRELNDRMLRIAADFENYKKRVRREMEDAGVRGMEGLLRELLPVLDNLDRAIDSVGASPRPSGVGAHPAEGQGPIASALLDGVRLVQKQFLGALEKFQIKSFEAQGKPFDPQFHEAVQQIDSDTLPPGTVATVFQRGYMAGSRLLRPALVAVVRGRAQPEPAGDEPAELDLDEQTLN